MHYRKTVLLAIVTLLLFAGRTIAQDSLRTTAETRAEKMTGKMKTGLSLSDDQYKKVYDINLKYIQKAEALKDTDDRMAKMKARKADNEAKTKELKAVLSKEQFDKYQQMQEEVRKEMKEKIKARRGNR